MPAPISRRHVLIGGASVPLASCSGLNLLNNLNALTPGDRGVRRVAADRPFGTHPRQRLDVYARKDLASDAPVLVFFYGGAWSSGRRQDYVFAAQAFAARGFITVIPDYRLVPEVRFPVFLQDGAAALRWVTANIREWGGAPSRLALAGHSAGAYIALMLALDVQWLRAERLDPALVRSAAGLAGPYDFYPFDVAATKLAFGQAPDPRATQPIAFARPDAPPVFLATGDKDVTVEPQNSIALAKALKDAGTDVELKIYPGLDHADTALALSRTFRGRAQLLDDATDFLKRALSS